MALASLARALFSRALAPLAKASRAELVGVVGMLAATLVAVFANVYAGRHYSRWDVTENRRYTLSEATKATLRDLPDRVEIWVLLGGADPLHQSVAQLLESYRAETSRLDVKYVDPDRDTLLLEDVRKRFKIETGRTEDGHVVADAVVIVALGDRRWFLTPMDLYEASEKDDRQVRPREEQALTLALRNVTSGERARLCFTEGHDEMSLRDGTEKGLFFLKNLLEKDNYEPVTIDTRRPDVHEPFKGCQVVVVAGPRGAFTKDEASRLRSHLLLGGSLFVAVGPVPARARGVEPTGLDEVLAPFGVALVDAAIIEKDGERALPDSGGVRFHAEPRPHGTTSGLLRTEERDAPRILLGLSRPLKHVMPEGAALGVELLITSPKAFGKVSLEGAATWASDPQPGPGDLPGPQIVAMASERARLSPGAPHGPRAVVLGSATPLLESNFHEPWAVRGAALLVENAISWLASKPQILDVPERASVPAGLRISADDRGEVRRYVLVFMPLCAALLGLAVGLRRRSTEGRPRRRPSEPPPTAKPGHGSGKKAKQKALGGPRRGTPGDGKA